MNDRRESAGDCGIVKRHDRKSSVLQIGQRFEFVSIRDDLHAQRSQLVKGIKRVPGAGDDDKRHAERFANLRGWREATIR